MDDEYTKASEAYIAELENERDDLRAKVEELSAYQQRILDLCQHNNWHLPLDLAVAISGHPEDAVLPPQKGERG